jgi:hypothetical protein
MNLRYDLDAASAHLQKLRASESRGGNIRTRTSFLLSLIENDSIATWRNSGIAVEIYFDSRGLKIDIGPNGAHGIHSHLPYSEISEASAKKLYRANLITTAGFYELLLKSGFDDITLNQKIEQLWATELNFQGNLNDRSALVHHIIAHSSEVIEKIKSGTLHFETTILKNILTVSDESNYLESQLKFLLSLAEALNHGTDTESTIPVLARSWNQLRQTHSLARTVKSAFEVRRPQLHLKSNYEVAKIFTAVLQTENLTSYAKITRGQFEGGSEFVAVWGVDWFYRVYLLPEIHFSKETLTLLNTYAPTILTRGDFEIFEALFIPYHAFKLIIEQITDLCSGQLDQHLTELSNLLLGLRTIAETEFTQTEFSTLYSNIRKTNTLLRQHGDIPHAQRKEFLESLRTSLQQYESYFVGKTAEEIISNNITPITLHNVSFNYSGTSYIPSVAGEITATIVTTQEKGLRYAQEGKMLRALKVTHRPVMVIAGGASHFTPDEATEEFTQIIVNFAFTHHIHVLIPETQVGIGAALAHAYQETLKTNRYKDSAIPVFFGIGAGRDIVFPNNPLLESSDSNFPINPITTILTPYHAGWSGHGNPDSQRRHNYYRQALIKRIAHTHPIAIVSYNGGGWTTLENLTAAEDKTVLVPVSDSGRFATLFAHLISRTQEWRPFAECGNTTGLVTYLNAEIEKLPSVVHHELEKTFQHNQFFASELLELLQAVDINTVFPTTTKTLTNTLYKHLVP